MTTYGGKATYVGNDTWEATINIGDYKQSYDTFISHIYVTDNNGQQKYAGVTEKVIKNPFLEEPLAASAQQDCDVSKFVIRTQNCSGKPGSSASILQSGQIVMDRMR